MRPLFNCSQSDFILVVETGLNSFHEYLASFTARSPKYVLAWETTMRTDLAAAEAMPTEEVRDAEMSALGVELSEQGDLCRNFYQRLKGHIAAAFPENLVEIKQQAAGQKLYEKASENNWPSLLTMLSMAARFVAANVATLTANDEMPPAFPAEFDAAIAEFRLRLSTYQDFKETIMVERQERVAALNDIHKRLMPMMTTGQDIFKDNEAVRTQFVFNDVLKRITGPGLAGLDGKVTDNGTNLPISGALVKLFLPDNPSTEYLGTSDANGDYFVNCPSGTYSVTVSAVGYTPHTMTDIIISVGTVSKINVKLAAV